MAIFSEPLFWALVPFVLFTVIVFPVLLVLFMRRNHLVANLMRDTAVSSARVAEQLDIMDQQRRYMRATIDTALDAIIMMDGNGYITEFNPAAETIFGHDRNAVMGQLLSDVIIPEEYREAHRAGVERYQQSGQKKVIDQRIEIEAMTKAGDRIIVDLAITEARMKDGPVYIGFLRDITAQKKSELALQAALEDARQASEEKGRFLAMMSHEIRTPINGVLGVLGLLEEAPLSSEQQKFVQTGVSSANLLLELVNDILDFSKIEADKLELENSHFQVEDVTRPIVDIVRLRLTDREVTLLEEYAPDLPACLYGDAGRIRQVLLNLVSNAAKFTLDGQIVIRIQKRIDPDQGLMVRFDIQDTGIGIPADKMDDLFREFATVDPSYSRKFGGSGLGLAIAQGLIELMQGRIGCESEEDVGSTFWFEVPLKEGDLELSEPEPAQEEPEIVPNLVQAELGQDKREGRILLAEDNPANRMVVKAMIERAGYRVHTVADGHEAVAAVERIPYDLILMDISMPGMDGLEATRKIRKLPEHGANVPIIALTAHTQEGVRDKYLSAGMNDYLPKPGRRNQVLRKIDQWLSGAHEESQDITTPDQETEKAIGHLVDMQALEILGEDTDRDLVPRMVSKFLEDAEERLGRMKKAIPQSNFEEIELCSHALASSGATFGLTETHFIARRLEAASMLGNMPLCSQELALLDDTLIRSMSEMRQVMRHWSSLNPNGPMH